MKTNLLIIIPMALFGIISISESFAEEEIMIFVENDARKIYYTGENIISTFYDHKSRSVIFEIGMDAKLEIKAPQIYKKGPELFILKNGEEIAGVTRADDCFYYVDIKTKVPEKIEIIFAYWPEYPETKEGCETFTVSPLKQYELGISVNEIQCKESLVLITKHDDSPVCVKSKTAVELTNKEKRSGWNVGDQLWKLLSEKMNEYGPKNNCPRYCITLDEKYVVDGIDKTLGNSSGLPKFFPEGYDNFQFHHREVYSVVQISTKPISLDTSWNDFYWKDNGIFLRYSEVPVTVDGMAQIEYWAKTHDAKKLNLPSSDEPAYLKEREISYSDELDMLYPTFSEAQFNYGELVVVISGYISGEDMLKIADSFFEK